MSEFIFEPINQWKFFGKWFDFDLIAVSFMKDDLFTGYEFTLIILGLGFYFRWNDVNGEGYKEIMKEVKRIKKRIKNEGHNPSQTK